MMMAMKILLLPLGLASTVVYAQTTFKVVTASIIPVPTSTASPSSTATPTGCAAIAAIHREFFSGNPNATLNDVPPFLPSLAHECQISVPLVKENATAFIDWYLPYLEFQSSLAWLKTPPPSYQQPAVDLIGGLNNIRAQVLNGTFSNQYDFEGAISQLLQQAHEGHLALATALYQEFIFQVPYDFVSVSPDGKSMPAVYTTEDLLAAANGTTNWWPSYVTLMNGQNVTDWFTAYAKKNVRAQLEPHSDWNFMFNNRARDLGLAGGLSSSALRATINYPGTDWLNLTFANGSTVSRTFRAYSTKDLSSVTNGTDLYSLLAPKNTTATATATAAPVSTTLPQLGLPYPSPIMVQEGLGSGGFVSGYFLNDTSTAVLSITSFHMGQVYAQTFQTAVQEFITKCHEAKMKKLVIDLQGNGGGVVLLAFDLFKQLFPTAEPFGGSRFRASKAFDTIGKTLALAPDQSTNPLSPQNNLKADGTDFASWSDYFGPVSSHGDFYTNTARWNFSQGALTEQLSGYGIVVSGYANRTQLQPQHFLPSDIILLTDGFCASTCAVFAETMKTEMGVRSVVVGGRPEKGPMQAVSGTRGAVTMTSIEIDDAITVARTINSSIQLGGDSGLPVGTNLSPIYLTEGTAPSFNLRDQVRRNVQDVLVQFVYEAADCRVLYTREMVGDYRVLWQYAADAVWNRTDGGMCVEGSVGQWSSGANVTDISGGDNVTVASGGGSGNGSGVKSEASGRGSSWLGMLVLGVVALGVLV